VVDAEINPDSTIAKYIKDLSKLKLPKLNLEELKNVTLDQAPVKSLQTGIKFEQPVNIGVDNTEIKIGGGISGSLTLLSTDDEQLFDPEVFADSINIGPNQFYVGVATSATVSSGLTHETGDLSFGFDAGSRNSLTSYKLRQRHQFQHSLANGIDYLVTGGAGQIRTKTPDEFVQRVLYRGPRRIISCWLPWTESK
jgi:hypothetical protein